ncbi:hypothetical protein RI367_006049 [Sorochytrium milnesiophthora]
MSRRLWTLGGGAVLAAAAAGAYALDPWRWRRRRSEGHISSSHYAPARLLSVQRVSPTIAEFTFAVDSLDGRSLSDSLPVPFYVSFRNDLMQVQRPYTPIRVDHGSLVFLVKRYADGETSKWIHRLQSGTAVVDMKGPLISEWTYSPTDTPKRIGMIAGGTGIAPFFQLINHVLASSSGEHTLSLVYAAATPQELVLKDQLDALAAKYPTRFKVHYTVDNPGTNDQDKWTGHVGFISAKMVADVMPRPGEGLVLVCGPDQMVAHVAGPHGAAFRTQGPLGGLLRQLGYSGDEIVKLSD